MLISVCVFWVCSAVGLADIQRETLRSMGKKQEVQIEFWSCRFRFSLKCGNGYAMMQKLGVKDKKLRRCLGLVFLCCAALIYLPSSVLPEWCCNRLQRATHPHRSHVPLTLPSMTSSSIEAPAVFLFSLNHFCHLLIIYQSSHCGYYTRPFWPVVNWPNVELPIILLLSMLLL